MFCGKLPDGLTSVTGFYLLARHEHEIKKKNEKLNY